MKRLVLLMLLLVTAFEGFSQTKGISYQAVILSPKAQEIPGTNVQGNILANSAVSIQFTIVNASGTEEYKENQTTKTDRYGMINLLIGTGTQTSSNDFAAIVWSGNTKKLKVGIDFSGGSNFSPLSEQNLTYMPQPPTVEVTIEMTKNSAAISTLKSEQTTQNSAIALNTAKTGITPAQATTISNTTGINTGDQNISGIAINAGAITTLKTEQTTQNTSIALNTAKTGITSAQASEIVANTLKIGYTDALVSANAAVAANTTKVGITAQQANDISTNNTKTGVTVAQATTISNTTGINTGDQNISGIAINAGAITTLKSEQTSQNSAIALNTAKAGITPAQASEIVANTLKVGYTDALVSANATVAANTAKVGITAQQADDINTNNTKTGITTAQASEIAANTLKVGYTDALVSANAAVAANTAKVGITAQQAIDITTNNAKVGFTNSLVSVNKIIDADANTKIQVEKNANEDIIRFDLTGTEKWVMQGSRLEPKNSGNSVFIGEGAGAADDLTANNNVFIGYDVGGQNTTGFGNVANGYESLRANTTGNSNTASGQYSLLSNTTGSGNVASGNSSLASNSGGSNNTASGIVSMNSNKTGNNNVANGYYAGYANTTGSNNTFIGNVADASAGDLDNATAIGNGAIVNASNKVQIGDALVTAVQLGTGINATLETGLVKITGGNPGIGKLLTSDANGLASWATSGGSANLEEVLILGNDANGNNIVNTGKIGIGTATPNAQSSMEIATPLPVIFPSMTQTQVNAILAPVEGMVQFNADAHKLQVYAMLTDNAEIFNEIYIGNESGSYSFYIGQSFTSPIDGQVIAVELMFKDADGGSPDIDFMGQGTYTVPSYSQFTWHTFILTNPRPVTAGVASDFAFMGRGVDYRSFATNSNYPNGFALGLNTSDDDILFRVYIQPVVGSFGWQSMN
jgi:hypothetical protein